MKTARLSDQAKEDLVQIWEYIAEDNSSAADRLIQSLVTQYKSLADNPGIGRRRTELRPDLRSFPVGNYLIFYRPMPDGVAVLRIVHGARDLETLFNQNLEESYRFESNKENDK